MAQVCEFDLTLYIIWISLDVSFEHRDWIWSGKWTHVQLCPLQAGPTERLKLATLTLRIVIAFSNATRYRMTETDLNVCWEGH